LILRETRVLLGPYSQWRIGEKYRPDKTSSLGSENTKRNDVSCHSSNLFVYAESFAASNVIKKTTR
jgi:hypothetical protein